MSQYFKIQQHKTFFSALVNDSREEIIHGNTIFPASSTRFLLKQFPLTQVPMTQFLLTFFSRNQNVRKVGTSCYENTLNLMPVSKVLLPPIYNTYLLQLYCNVLFCQYSGCSQLCGFYTSATPVLHTYIPYY